MPVDVPMEYLSMQTNGYLEELLEAYKELQEEVRIRRSLPFSVI
jgi:hypothetical protein